MQIIAEWNLAVLTGEELMMSIPPKKRCPKCNGYAIRIEPSSGIFGTRELYKCGNCRHEFHPDEE
jgi:hypothetical protein